MTYSIIGRDPRTVELGVVQSHWFHAQQDLAWIEPDDDDDPSS